MIEIEPVRRTPPPQGGGVHTWRMCHSRRLLDLLGVQSEAALIRSLAATLHEGFPGWEFTVWAVTEPDRFCTYFCFAAPGPPPHLLEGIAAEHAARLSEAEGAVPPVAEPVLKHRPDGSLVRLWPAGTAGLQPTTQLAADWSVFTIENRYYSLID